MHADTDGDLDHDTTGWDPGLTRLYRYWASIHPASGLLPGRQHFDPVFVPDLLPGITLIDIQRVPLRLRYRLAGTRVVRAIGREVTGRWLDEAHPGAFVRGGLADRCRHVVERGIPDRYKGRPLLPLHADIASVEKLLLPMARDGRQVDMLCAYTVFYRGEGTIDH